MPSIFRLNKWTGALLVAAFLCLGALFWYRTIHMRVYSPTITPSNFVSAITHPLFSLPAGVEFSYKGVTDDGETETITITIPGTTKKIMDVETMVYIDKVYTNGELVESTVDYLAQDKDGNVWYFGEEVDNYESGKISNHDGSWIAGTNGALPGIWMPANPYVGQEYRQEYQPGIAEDMGTVLAIDEMVTTPYGTFSHCLKTLDWSNLIDPAHWEHKYYCPGVAAFVKETTTDGLYPVDLVDVSGKKD